MFTVVDNRKVRVPIPVHRLAAFQKFSEASLVEGVVTRHKDGNALNNLSKNLLLGTPLDNTMDRSPEARQRHALVAARATRKLSQEALASLRADRDKGMTYKELMTRYPVGKATLSGIFNGTLYLEP